VFMCFQAVTIHQNDNSGGVFSVRRYFYTTKQTPGKIKSFVV